MPKVFSIPFGKSGFLEFLFNPYLEGFGYTPLNEPSLYSLYIGKVLKEDKTLGGFFIDIGETTAFIPYNQTTEKLKVGDKRLFQIIREKVENKPPRLTQKFRLNLCGCNFLFNGGWKFKGEDCEKLLESIEKFFSFLSPKREIGLVLKWSFSLTKLLEYCGNIELIAESVSNEALEIAKIFNFKPKIGVKTLENLLNNLNFSKTVNVLLSKRIEFGGGDLLLRPSEGFTFIDVNGNLKAYALNLKAVQILPSVLGLKNIGGTIFVDFANMENTKEKKAFKEYLKETLKRINCRGFGFTNLGIYEMVCPKRTPNIWERLYTYSDYCGCEIKRDELLALEILEKVYEFRTEKVVFKIHTLRKKIEEMVKERNRWIEFEFDCSVGLNNFSI